jgi:short-subunit dehydrogenase
MDRTNTLRDRVIVITGASSGIGAATAVACAAEGMHVVLNARREDRLRQVAAACQQAGGKADIFVADVCDRDLMFAMIEQTVSRLGRLDAVFANAGYGLSAPVDRTTLHQARAIFETNFFGTLHVFHAATAAMRKLGGGHILICSSAASEIAPPLHGLYSATKAAQDSIGCAMRAELAGENIHVTTVHPVGTHTEFWQAMDRASDPTYHRGNNTPKAMRQSADKVAVRIVKALRRPCPEVWPNRPARFGLAVMTACPRLSAYVMRRMMKARP